MVSDAQKWLILAITLVIGYLLYLLAPILTPFLVSALLAYLGDPLADRLEQKKLSRTLAVCVVFIVMLVLIAIFLFIAMPLIESQLLRLIKRIPEILDTLQQSWLPWLATTLGVDLGNINLQGLKSSLDGNWKAVGNMLGIVISRVSTSGQTVILWLSYFLLIAVVTFFLLRDWDHLVEKTAVLIPW